jgi:hypothetical protein
MATDLRVQALLTGKDHIRLERLLEPSPSQAARGTVVEAWLPLEGPRRKKAESTVDGVTRLRTSR